jgi:hypothetical protein
MYMHIILSITMGFLDKRKTSSYTYLQKKYLMIEKSHQFLAYTNLQKLIMEKHHQFLAYTDLQKQIIEKNHQF